MGCLDVIHPSVAIRTGGRTGAWDVDRRLAEMDSEGVAGQGLNQGHTVAVSLWFGERSINAQSAVLRAARARAHHRWLRGLLGLRRGRLAAVLDAGPCLDMNITVAELRWAGTWSCSCGDTRGLGDVRLPPLRRLLRAVHAPAGDSTRNMSAAWRGGGDDFSAARQRQFVDATQPTDGLPDKEVFGLGFTSAERTAKCTALPRQVMSQLMLAGVFDRHPTLKLAITELRAYWIPSVLRHVDGRFSERRAKTTLKPTDSFARDCAVTPSYIRPIEVPCGNIGVERLMFATDYRIPSRPGPTHRIGSAQRSVPPAFGRMSPRRSWG